MSILVEQSGRIYGTRYNTPAVGRDETVIRMVFHVARIEPHTQEDSTCD